MTCNGEISSETVFKDGANLFHAKRLIKNTELVVALDSIRHTEHRHGSQYLRVDAHNVKTGKEYYAYARYNLFWFKSKMLWLVPMNQKGDTILVELERRA